MLRYSPARLLLATLLILSAVACGGSDSAAPEPRRATTVEVTGPESLITGSTATYSAVVRDQDGNRLSGAQVTWSASPSSVLEVTSPATVLAMGAGAGTITATSGSASGSTSVTVTDPPTLDLES